MEKIMLKKILFFLLCLVVTSNAIAEDEPIRLKFSHVVSNDTPKGRAADFFKDRVHDLTNGRIEIEIYPEGKLYKDKDEIEALQRGDVQIIAPALGKLGAIVPEFGVFDIPYLFDNYIKVHEVANGSPGRQLFGKLESKGMRGLAYWDSGFKVLSANFSIKTPADLKGKKIRIQPAIVGSELQIKGLQAVPIAIPVAEQYQALQKGTVDGAENPIVNFYTQNLYEVQKHLTLTEHGFLGYAVIINKDFWDKLPDWARSALTKAMANATDYANNLARNHAKEYLLKITQTGKTEVNVLIPEERESFKKALVPVQKEMAQRLGTDEALKAIYQTTGFTP